MSRPKVAAVRPDSSARTMLQNDRNKDRLQGGRPAFRSRICLRFTLPDAFVRVLKSVRPERPATARRTRDIRSRCAIRITFARLVNGFCLGKRFLPGQRVRPGLHRIWTSLQPICTSSIRLQASTAGHPANRVRPAGPSSLRPRGPCPLHRICLDWLLSCTGSAGFRLLDARPVGLPTSNPPPPGKPKPCRPDPVFAQK